MSSCSPLTLGTCERLHRLARLRYQHPDNCTSLACPPSIPSLSVAQPMQLLCFTSVLTAASSCFQEMLLCRTWALPACCRCSQQSCCTPQHPAPLPAPSQTTQHCRTTSAQLQRPSSGGAPLALSAACLASCLCCSSCRPACLSPCPLCLHMRQILHAIQPLSMLCTTDT